MEINGKNCLIENTDYTDLIICAYTRYLDKCVKYEASRTNNIVAMDINKKKKTNMATDCRI